MPMLAGRRMFEYTLAKSAVLVFVLVMHMNLAFGVDSIALMRHLNMVRSAIGMLLLCR